MWRAIGHEWATNLLAKSIENDNLSHAYLFTGPSNIGKTTLALDLASALNCHGSSSPCGECVACRKIAAGTHPDVRVLSGENKAIGIDQIRQLQREATLSPFEGNWRVHVLCDFQNATTEAANCLLKTLEEPPAYEVLVLTAPEADLLLPTVVSRCQPLTLRLLSTTKIRDALQNSFAVPREKAELLARLSGGRIGWAISAIQDDSVLTSLHDNLNSLVSLLKVKGTHRWSHIDSLDQKPGALKATLDLWSCWWRDVLMLKMGCKDQMINLNTDYELSEAANNFSPEEIYDVLKATLETQRQLQHNANVRLALEVLFLKYPLMTGTNQRAKMARSVAR